MAGFLFGTQEDDASCVAGDYPTPDQDEDGNGLEYGYSRATMRGSGYTAHHRRYQRRMRPVRHRQTGSSRSVTSSCRMPLAMRWCCGPTTRKIPLAFVFKRARRCRMKSPGAWLWSEGVDDQFAVVRLPARRRDVRSVPVPRLAGLLRESFTMDGDVMTSQAGGYTYCVDTENDPAQSNCLGQQPHHRNL